MQGPRKHAGIGCSHSVAQRHERRTGVTAAPFAKHQLLCSTVVLNEGGKLPARRGEQLGIARFAQLRY